MMKKPNVKLALRIGLCVVALLAFNCVAFAETGDTMSMLTSAMETGLSELATGIMGIVAIIIPTVLTIAGTTIAIKKGLGLMKSLVGR